MYKLYTKNIGGCATYTCKVLLMMKLTTLLLILTIMPVSAASLAQKISLHEKDAPIEKIFNQIRVQSGYDFIFNRNLLKTAKRVNIHVVNANLEDALTACFAKQPFTFTLQKNTIIVKPRASTESLSTILKMEVQQLILKGKVTDEQGLPLMSASVQLKPTAGSTAPLKSTATNNDGEFSITTSIKTGVLIVRYLGYITQEIPIDQRAEYLISMKPELNALNEVVVTALGIKREERSLGYSTQKLSSADISTVKSDNFVNSLSGKVAGIQIKRSSNLGGSANVVIRGNKSLTRNNQALYVIDGVPVNDANNNTDDQQVGKPGFDFGNAASDINPDDVESINVLKGAAATALYGSRAANGVIMITTKNGSGSTAFSVVVNSGFNFGRVDKSTFPTYQTEYGAGYGADYASPDGFFYLEDVDGDGVKDLTAPYREDASYGGRFSPSLLVYQWDSFDPSSKNYKKATPWMAAQNGPITFFENPVTFNNNISLSGSNNKNSYRLSYSNLDQSGLMPNSKLKRNNLSLNTTFNLLPQLVSNTSVNYVKTNATGRNNTGYGPNIVNTLRQWWQTNIDIKDLEDIYFKTKRNVTWNPSSIASGAKPLYTDNPYWQVYENFEQDSRERIIANTNLNYKLTSWLSAQGRISVDTYKSTQETRIAVGSTRAGEYTVGNGDFSEYNYDLMLNVNKQLTEKLSLAGIVGFNSRRTNYRSINQKTNGGLVIPRLYALSNSLNTMQAPVEVQSTIGVDGYYGSASFGYDNFLYLDVTGRSDISSTLPKGGNRYFYPSVSSSFIFSKFLDYSWLSLGKLRGGYAQVGNDASFASLYDTYRKPTPFGNVPLFTVSDIKNNENLKPEKTKSLEAGLEMAFLKNRLSFDFSIYKTNTINQIMPVAVTEVTGYTNRYVNAGEIENKGLEFVLRATPIASKDIQWKINLNFSKNRNKVISLYDNIDNIQLGYFNGGGVSFNASIGQPFGVLKGKDFVYLNGDKTIDPTDGKYIITTSSNQNIGNMNPDWNAGISNNISFKNFDLGFLIDIQKGGSVFSADRWYGSSSGVYAESAGLNDLGNPLRNPLNEGGGVILDGVFPDGTKNNIRVQMGNSQNALSYASGRMPQKAFVYDASYVKLRELTLTYNLPAKLLKSTPVKNASIAFIGSNLWILHKNTPYSDPEAGISGGNIQGYQTGVLPSTRNYGFNLKVQF